MKISNLFIVLISSCLLFIACKKEENATSEESTDKMLIIEENSVSLAPSESFNLTATYVHVDGSVSTPSSVVWTSSDNSIVQVSGNGIIEAKGVGSVKITAKVNGDLAESVVKVVASYPFLVIPGTYAGFTGETLQLESIYHGSQTSSFTYLSSNSAIADVSSTGLVTLKSAGLVMINVESSLFPGNPFPVSILVWPSIDISLPVTKVELNPAAVELFRGDQRTVSAKAYDINGDEVNANFIWSSMDPSIATVQNGIVSGVKIGTTKISATANGISGFCEVNVSPDTVVIISPFVATIPAGGTKQFSAEAYNVRTATVISSITSFDWLIPSYGVSIFDIGTVDNNGLVTIKSSAFEGMNGFLAASVPGSSTAIGVSMIVVGTASDCGVGNSDVASITTDLGSTATLSILNGAAALNSKGLDAFGNQVANPELKFNSSDQNVVRYDDIADELIPIGPGTATLTICSGSFATAAIQITVNF